MDCSSQMTLDDVGAIVIGRNEGERLVSCLQSVKSGVRDFVYVDSGSTDGSISAASEIGASIVELDLSQPFTAARARNEGFSALRMRNPNVRFVQFIDGDCTLSPGWLSKAYTFIYRRSDVAIVCGRRRERNPEVSVYNRLCDVEWDTTIGETLTCGGDSLVRVEAFESQGGFNGQLIAGEEPELCLRLREKGWKIWRLDAEMTRHDAAMTRFSQWWVRTVRSGYGMTEVVQLHWRSPLAIWKKEVARAVFWSGLFPLFIGLSALMYPVSLLAVLVYPIQICRIAIARGPALSSHWTYAFFLTLGKFAELQGILKFQWGRLRGRSIKLIEYK